MTTYTLGWDDNNISGAEARTSSAAASGSNTLVVPEQVTELSIHHMDVGQGESTIVLYRAQVSPEKWKNVLVVVIDGGLYHCGHYLEEYLKKYGVEQIDVLLNTHYEADHAGGLCYLLERKSLPIHTVITRSNILDDKAISTQAGEKLRKTILSCCFTLYTDTEPVVLSKALNRKLLVLKKDDIFKPALQATPPLKFKCVAVRDAPTLGEENPSSIGLLITFGDFKYFTAGDLESNPTQEDQEDCIARQIAPIHAFKAGHHGSDKSTSKDFLATIQPCVAFISSGKQSYEHPRSTVTQRLHDCLTLKSFFATNCVHNRVELNPDFMKQELEHVRCGSTESNEPGYGVRLYMLARDAVGHHPDRQDTLVALKNFMTTRLALTPEEWGRQLAFGEPNRTGDHVGSSGAHQTTQHIAATTGGGEQATSPEEDLQEAWRNWCALVSQVRNWFPPDANEEAATEVKVEGFSSEDKKQLRCQRFATKLSRVADRFQNYRGALKGRVAGNGSRYGTIILSVEGKDTNVFHVDFWKDRYKLKEVEFARYTYDGTNSEPSKQTPSSQWPGQFEVQRSLEEQRHWARFTFPGFGVSIATPQFVDVINEHEEELLNLFWSCGRFGSKKQLKSLKTENEKLRKLLGAEDTSKPPNTDAIAAKFETLYASFAFDPLLYWCRGALMWCLWHLYILKEETNQKEEKNPLAEDGELHWMSEAWGKVANQERAIKWIEEERKNGKISQFIFNGLDGWGGYADDVKKKLFKRENCDLDDLIIDKIPPAAHPGSTSAGTSGSSENDDGNDEDFNDDGNNDEDFNDDGNDEDFNDDVGGNTRKRKRGNRN